MGVLNQVCTTKILHVQIQLNGGLYDFKTPDAHAPNAGWVGTNNEIVHFWGGSTSIEVPTYPRTAPVTANIMGGFKPCGI
jgi:hypothetical protein